MRRRDFMRIVLTSGAAAAAGIGCEATREERNPRTMGDTTHRTGAQGTSAAQAAQATNGTTHGGGAHGAGTSTGRMPVVFLAHGAPMLLDDARWVGELAAWARRMPKPRAILVLSAHWLDAPVTLSATRPVPLVYDFYGFPQRFYQLTYASPGAPELAARVSSLLTSAGAGPVQSSDRGLDHGVYVPLLAMYPEADVPVLQVSLPTLDPVRLLALGRALAPLRDEGVLVVGSGFLTHNMRAFGPSIDASPPAWATEFDAWTKNAFARTDVDALVTYRERAPGVDIALPTHEHFVPALAALGTALGTPGTTQAPSFPIEGFWFGSFTRRSIQWG